MKVLFVDDEAHVLAGIERSLFALDRDWELAFADSGESALRELEHRPADVVISDMRMPGMDGAELLHRVQQRWPATLRIVLSGFTEQAAALRALRVAQQFLSKPCEGAALVETVERLIAVRELLQSPRLRACLGKVAELPSSPRSFIRLDELTREPGFTTAAISAVIDHDPALSATVLKLANSAYFQRSHPIVAVHAAVVRLGVSLLRSLVLAAECFKSTQTGIDVETLRSRALLASLIARRLAPTGCDPEICASAALLAEIGRLLPDCVAAGANTATPISYAEIGAYLLGIWGLPLTIIDAVAHHRRPQHFDAHRFGPIGVVHVATTLAAGEVVDPVYLDSIGMADRWPAWQRLTEALSADELA